MKRKPKITAWQLALIAAPLIAKGHFIDDALKFAYRIYLEAEKFISKL